MITCVVLHALLPPPEIVQVSTKLQYFAAHKDEFDTLFVGSSRIYHHIVPETFDAAMAEQGKPTQSFNLGIAGMHTPESFYVLERALACEPTKLKTVFLELEELYPRITPEKLGTRRLLYWHTWPLTWLTIAKAVNPDGRRPLYKILARTFFSSTARDHLGLFLKNYANVGGIRDLLDLFARRRGEMGGSRDLLAQRGYAPSANKISPEEIAQYRDRVQSGMPEEDLEDEEQRDARWNWKHFRQAGTPMGPEQVVDFQRLLREGMSQDRHRPIDPMTEKGYRDMARKLSARGAKLICVVPPDTNQTRYYFRGDTFAPVLAFNDLKKFPQLYNPAVRVDRAHLTNEGAEMMTRLLADEFVNQTAPAK